MSDTKPLLGSQAKPTKKSSKNRRAPKAPQRPQPKSNDLDAILPYEEPVKSSDLENWSHEDAEQIIPKIKQNDEVKEIKPKKLSGTVFGFKLGLGHGNFCFQIK